MGCREKSCLECRWCEVNAAVECGVKEALEHLYIRLLRVLVAVDRPGAEEESPHRSGRARSERDACIVGDSRETIHEIRRSVRDFLMQLARERGERRIPCCHSKRI